MASLTDKIGPNTLSINSPNAQYIYSPAAHMAKSDSYRAIEHPGRVALFFKQPTEKIHTDRKRVWSAMFTKEGLVPYVRRSAWFLLQKTLRVAELLPVLEERTFELLACMERRQAESAKGCVDMTDTFYHWSHDFMVS